ncbi:hypothetical protein EDC01DRAFT_223540 [Geopyxis carbonaria]|nr:hypothetical protein EDC01DRAFT_223540 [Geopyxis carbonaria]
MLTMTPRAHGRKQPHLSPASQRPSPYNSTNHSSFTSINTSTHSNLSALATSSASSTPLTPSLPALPTISWTPLSTGDIAGLSPANLRYALSSANSLISTLTASLSAMRTTAAHWHLQHKLLALETSEAHARHQVEADITHTQVEVLRLGQSNAALEEAAAYKRRLRKAKRAVRDYREEVAELWDENERLRRRVREQHQVIRDSRSPVVERERARGSNAQQEPDEPDERDRDRDREREGTEGREGLVALGYLASQVLSQSQSQLQGGPATPRRRRHTVAPHPHPQRLLSPVPLSSSKRRRSRDSTISLSNDEDGGPDDDIVVPSPSPRKRVRRESHVPNGVGGHGVGMPGTPVSPHKTGYGVMKVEDVAGR